jgi:transposase-like protein
MSDTVNMDHENLIPFTDDQHQRMILMYETNTPSRRIAEVFGVSQQTVLRRLRTFGIEIKRQGNPGMRT